MAGSSELFKQEILGSSSSCGMWKSLVQGHVDYCSQLYFPTKSSDMEKIENLQKMYTSKIPEVKTLNYWDRLNYLKMYSQERRMEQYRILYERISPNCGLEVKSSERRGREVIIPPSKGSGKFHTLREGSFQVNGPRLFNSLPKKIRNLTRISLEDFKIKLDKHLENIPDEPKIGGLVPNTSNQITMLPSNSIIDHAKTISNRGQGGVVNSPLIC